MRNAPIPRLSVLLFAAAVVIGFLATVAYLERPAECRGANQPEVCRD